MLNECLTGVKNDIEFRRACKRRVNVKNNRKKTFYENKWKTVLLGGGGGQAGINFLFQS